MTIRKKLYVAACATMLLPPQIAACVVFCLSFNPAASAWLCPWHYLFVCANRKAAEVCGSQVLMFAWGAQNPTPQGGYTFAAPFPSAHAAPSPTAMPYFLGSPPCARVAAP